MKRKICVVTGSRAEYGLLRRLMLGIQNSEILELQTLVTGTHLSSAFGSTVEEIRKDGFYINRQVEMLLSSDSPSAITKSMGVGMLGFADALSDLKPDLVLVLGDRFEILAASIAATIQRIPIAHLHGGETTEGAIDEAFRHSITKMAHLHFVAAEEYRKRVIQLGENPGNVFTVGALGVDNALSMELLSRFELERSLEFCLGDRSLLITFHPVTLESDTAEKQVTELLAALSALKDTQLIFTAPNADADNQIIRINLEDFVRSHTNARLFSSLGVLKYLSCIKYVDGVVGNSSSGLIEVPSFKVGTINIGDRQRGRLKADSVIDCAPDRHSIQAALDKLFSKEFRQRLLNVRNPNGEIGTVSKVLHLLETVSIDQLLKKSFHALSMENIL